MKLELGDNRFQSGYFCFRNANNFQNIYESESKSANSVYTLRIICDFFIKILYNNIG